MEQTPNEQEYELPQFFKRIDRQLRREYAIPVMFVMASAVGLGINYIAKPFEPASVAAQQAPLRQEESPLQKMVREYPE